MIGRIFGLLTGRGIGKETALSPPAAAQSAMADRMQGALLLGAVADAYGYVVEFRSGDQIAADIANGFGFCRSESWLYDGIGHVASDDTQMTLFTAEACLNALRSDVSLTQTVPDRCREAYLSWYKTQTGSFKGGDGLVGNRRLHQRRAPGATCLQALARGGWGTTLQPINDSKGCGGIMRVAPIAFLPGIGLEETWTLGCASAAVTHGHVLGWSSAGAFAVMLRLVAQGESIPGAAAETYDFVRERPGGVEIGHRIEDSMTFAGRRSIAMEEIERLGGGWVAEECLSIGLAAAMMNADVPSRIAVAAHHSGDSDSTASICGQLIGAVSGRAAIESDVYLSARIANLDLHDEIDAVVKDFGEHL